jgi:hypothetical protein
MRALLFATTLIVASMPAALLAQANSDSTASAPSFYTTLDTPIGTLLDDPAARAIVEKYLPELTKGGRADMVRSSTFKAIQGYSGGKLTDKVLADMDADLATLGPHAPPAQIAGNRPTINVNEAKVRPYTLPDPLVLSSGKSVRDAKTWWRQRRPEVLSMFETQEYGQAPGRPSDQHFDVFDKATSAYGGKATRKQVMIHLSKDPAAPRIQLVEYIPATAKGPVPMFLMIGFTAASSMFDDPGILEGAVWNPQSKQRVPASQLPQMAQMKVDPLPFLDAGIGVAAFYYGDVDPDFPDGYALGIRALYAKGDETSRAPDAWGSISAWAWAMSRVQDYFETDKSVDAKRVAINGASRLGKTVLWAAARDQRFAAVIACCSGEGGASLSHRNFGETIASLTAMAPYQFARNYQHYADNEQALPMDSHMLLALIAPRPVLLQTGKYDNAGDPKGEFLAAVAAGPVYRLLGKADLGTSEWPPNEPILHDIGYEMNSGGHGMQPGDWDIYLAFLKRHLLLAK